MIIISKAKVKIYRQTMVDGGEITSRDDLLATEVPLKIRVTGSAPIATMCTPVHDLEFTAGLLLGEGVIKGCEGIIALDHTAGLNDAVRVGLRARAKARTAWLKLSWLSTSACGL